MNATLIGLVAPVTTAICGIGWLIEWRVSDSWYRKYIAERDRQNAFLPKPAPEIHHIEETHVHNYAPRPSAPVEKPKRFDFSPLHEPAKPTPKARVVSVEETGFTPNRDEIESEYRPMLGERKT